MEQTPSNPIVPPEVPPLVTPDIPLLIIEITKIENREKYKITVNEVTKSEKASPLQVLKFLAMYAVTTIAKEQAAALNNESETQPEKAQFIFQNDNRHKAGRTTKGKIQIRISLDKAIELSSIYESTSNASKEVMRITKNFLPENSICENYLERTTTGVQKAILKNIRIELDQATINALEAELTKKSAATDLKEFILKPFKKNYILI